MAKHVCDLAGGGEGGSFFCHVGREGGRGEGVCRKPHHSPRRYCEPWQFATNEALVEGGREGRVRGGDV